MNGKVAKKINTKGAMGYRKVGEGETMNCGPTYVITVPESYTKDEMEHVLDLAMAAPDDAIGTAIVVQEGVCFTKIADACHTKMRYIDEDPDEDPEVDPEVEHIDGGDDGWG